MQLLRVSKVLAALLLLFSGGAFAGSNDLELWRLGHPASIATCSVCDGTDRQAKDGDLTAQKRFARLAAAIGLAAVPAFGEPGATTGQAGLELGFTTDLAFPKLDANEWPGVNAAAAPSVLVLPTLRVRKGLGGSLELGTAVSMVAGSQMVALSAELRWALLEGMDYAPDVALRAWGTRLLGTKELDLALAGGDVTLSKSFGVGGMVALQPYGQYGLAMVNVSSGVIDFDPAHEDVRDPTADDGVFHNVGLFQNRYHRFALGVRLVAGAAVVGLEWAVAFGTNPVQTDGLAAGTTADTQFTRQMSGAAQLGVKF